MLFTEDRIALPPAMTKDHPAQNTDIKSVEVKKLTYKKMKIHSSCDGGKETKDQTGQQGQEPWEDPLEKSQLKKRVGFMLYVLLVIFFMIQHCSEVFPYIIKYFLKV